MQKQKWMKKIYALLLLLLLSFLLSACSISESDGTKIKELDYTVVENEKVPEDLLSQIKEKREADFKMTYEDGDDLYIVRGYGEQETGGYSISVNEVYLTADSIYFNSTLIGPQEAQKKSKAPSYPYIVVKTKMLNKNVVFD